MTLKERCKVKRPSSSKWDRVCSGYCFNKQERLIPAPPPPLWPSLRSTQHLATVETFSCLGPLRPSGRSASYHWISQLSDSPSITVRSWMIVKETDFCFSSISLEFLPLLYIRFLLSSLLLPSFCLFLRRKSNKWSTNFDGFSTTERNGDNYPSKTVTVDL